MLKRFASLSFLACAATVACTNTVPLGQAPGASTPGGSNDQDAGTTGGAATGPWGITCKTYWRAEGTQDALQEQTFTTRSDATTEQSIVYPLGSKNASATIVFAIAPAAGSNDESLLTVKTPTQKSTQEYRIRRAQRPAAQFAGDHGFTGLVYAGGGANGGVDLQYICSADGATAPPRQASVVPLDVVCQVELRTTPGGNVEKRDTVTYSATTPGESIGYEEVAFVLAGSDDPFEGRSITVGISRDPLVPGGKGGVRQLFQIDRNTELQNQLAGTTFSGRVSLLTAANKELSYACSSRGSGSAPVCPDLSDQACNPGCNTGQAQLYAPQRDCRVPDARIVTCNAPIGQTDDIACSVRSDGTILLGSGSLREVKGFVPCDADVADRAVKAPVCPF